MSEFDSDFHAIPPVKGNISDFYNLLTDKTRIGIPRENITVCKTKHTVKFKKNNYCKQAAKKTPKHSSFTLQGTAIKQMQKNYPSLQKTLKK